MRRRVLLSRPPAVDGGAGKVPGMRSKRLTFKEGFRVAFEVRKAQAAEMVIPPGEGEGGPDNRHRGADQWLFVVEGRG